MNLLNTAPCYQSELRNPRFAICNHIGDLSAMRSKKLVVFCLVLAIAILAGGTYKVFEYMSARRATQTTMLIAETTVSEASTIITRLLQRQLASESQASITSEIEYAVKSAAAIDAKKTDLAHLPIDNRVKLRCLEYLSKLSAIATHRAERYNLFIDVLTKRSMSTEADLQWRYAVENGLISDKPEATADLIRSELGAVIEKAKMKNTQYINDLTFLMMDLRAGAFHLESFKLVDPLLLEKLLVIERTGEK